MLFLKEKWIKLIGILLIILSIVVFVVLGFFSLIFISVETKNCTYACYSQDLISAAWLLTIPIFGNLTFILPGFYLVWGNFRLFMNRNKLIGWACLTIWCVSLFYVAYLAIHEVRSLMETDAQIKMEQKN